MKKSIFLTVIFFCLYSFMVLARSGGGYGHSCSHPSCSHASAHVSGRSVGEHECVHSVAHSESRPHISRNYRDNEFHLITTNHILIYYLLVYNHDANRIDTVKGNSKEDVKRKIAEMKEPERSESGLGDKIAVIPWLLFLGLPWPR